MDTAIVPHEERDPSTGHFLPGNRLSVGHKDPTKSRMGLLKQAMLSAATPDDMREVVRAMLTEAKNGNVFAAVFVRDTLIGKPQPMPAEDAQNIAEVVREEWRRWGKRTRTEELEIPDDAEHTVTEPPAGKS